MVENLDNCLGISGARFPYFEYHFRRPFAVLIKEYATGFFEGRRVTCPLSEMLINSRFLKRKPILAGPICPTRNVAPPRGSFILPGGKKDHDSRGTPREGSVALRVLAQGAWDHAETQAGTPVACRRDLAFDLVQAAKAGP